MKPIKEMCVGPQATLREALLVIDRGTLQLALVVDEQGALIGTVTDGDVRRGLLRGAGLDVPVSSVMNRKPHVLVEGASRADGLALMRQYDLRQVPVLGAGGKLVALQTIREMLETSAKPNWAVLMAGGMGTRLYPLTKDVPKPMIRVGDRPIIQIIIEHLASHGFRKVFVAVNYKAEVIEAFLGHGERLGVEIAYLKETERLGTAGALSLLPHVPSDPFLVMNGDLLTRMDFTTFLEAHVQSGAAASMALTTYEHQCPYGVVALEEGRIVKLEEKPTQQYLVNAGMYVLSPSALQSLSPGEPLDMPRLFERLVGGGLVCRGHPTTEYWMDVGRVGDLQKAQADFQ